MKQASLQIKQAAHFHARDVRRLMRGGGWRRSGGGAEGWRRRRDKFVIYIRPCIRAHNAPPRAGVMNSTSLLVHLPCQPPASKVTSVAVSARTTHISRAVASAAALFTRSAAANRDSLCETPRFAAARPGATLHWQDALLGAHWRASSGLAGVSEAGGHGV